MKNPYSEGLAGKRPFAPRVEPSVEAPVMAVVVDSGNIWRDGDLLVALKGAAFPDRCPITNEPATTRYTHDLKYVSPTAMLMQRISTGMAVFASLSICRAAGLHDFWMGMPVWMAAFTLARWVVSFWSEETSLEIPLADSHVRSFRIHTAIVAGISIGLLGLIYLVYLALAFDQTIQTIALLSSILTLLWGVLQMLQMRRELRVETMSSTHVWLRGVHGNYLADLPQSRLVRPS